MSDAKLLANIDLTKRDLIMTDINRLSAKLPFLLTPNKNEKYKGLRLGEKAVIFFDKSAALADEHPAILSSSFSVSDLQTRIADWKALCELKLQLDTLCHAINFTMMTYHKQNMSDCLYFYKLAKSAADQNIAGARAIVDVLEKMLPRTGKKSKKINRKEKRIIGATP